MFWRWQWYAASGNANSDMHAPNLLHNQASTLQFLNSAVDLELMGAIAGFKMLECQAAAHCARFKDPMSECCNALSWHEISVMCLATLLLWGCSKGSWRS